MTNTADIWVIILAAGGGTRLRQAAGVRKQYLPFEGRPLFWRSAATFSRIPAIKGLVFVFPADDFNAPRAELEGLFASEDLGVPWVAVPGGERRQDSVRHGLGALPSGCSAVLVHDAARPFASASLTGRVIDALAAGAAGVVPAIAVKDTIKRVTSGADDRRNVTETLNRSELVAVQTPQGFALDVLTRAHERAQAEGWEATDDASMVERLTAVAVVDGEEENVKITTPEDLARLSGSSETMSVTGFGYDVHRYGEGRPMVLGGVAVPKAPEVVAHSDGDVVLHALTDAILGLFGGGDIGLHFPDTDAANEALDSAVFVREAQSLAREKGVRIVHADVTIIAQTPRIGPVREAIAKNISRLLGLSGERVNVKATTEEGLGFTGEKKGIKAVACVTGLATILTTE